MLNHFFALILMYGSSAVDVPRADNGKRPEVKPITLKLVEELRITSDDHDDRYLWAGFDVAVQVNKAGHMFIVDDRENRIIQLDADGNFVRQIGREGQGPGEFDALVGLTVMDDQSLAAFDIHSPGTLCFFNPEGEFIEERSLIEGGGRNIKDLSFSPDGRWVFGRTTNRKVGTNLRLFEYALFQARDMELKHSLLKFQLDGFDPARSGDPKFWKKFLADRVGVDAKGFLGYVAYGRDGRVYTAVATRYEITRWSADLEKELVISREYKPIPMPEEEIDAIVTPLFTQAKDQLPKQYKHVISDSLVRDSLAMAGYPPVKLPVMGLKLTGDGMLVVIHDHNEITGHQAADLFDTDGNFRGSFSHGNFGLKRMVFQGDKAYTIETVDGDNQLVRYAVLKKEADQLADLPN
ncbi:MAG: 6-bladed beta-propeller [Acidobacteriota bacterium]|nr:6-bladed beta-propeller [Acidobacteriota bacterium]